MFERGDKEFILDMLICCRNILEYTQGMDFKTFSRDKKTIDAVIRNFEILGEAARNISNEFKREYSEINWRIIKGMRDKLIHFYFGVDKEIVWKTVIKDIPELKNKLEKIVRDKGWEKEIEN